MFWTERVEELKPAILGVLQSDLLLKQEDSAHRDDGEQVFGSPSMGTMNIEQVSACEQLHDDRVQGEALVVLGRGEQGHDGVLAKQTVADDMGLGRESQVEQFSK